jgi:predicted O-methyltransferase YrrM
MFSTFTILKKYISYFLKSSNGKGHGIHSPFVYSFIRDVLNGKTDDETTKRIELIRDELLKDETMLDIEDFGAGSASGLTNKRTVKRIASTSLKPKKYAQLLYRIVQKYQPQTIVELGTSLGITSAYLSVANPESEVFTFEGSSAIASKAQSHFNQIQLKNISLLQGPFAETLPAFLQTKEQLDFVFIDGHQDYEATVRYFEWMLPKIPDSGIVILDDIHWSKGMEQAWEEIRRHPRVKISIDLFFVGILFFRSEQFEQEHFTIRF